MPKFRILPTIRLLFTYTTTGLFAFVMCVFAFQTNIAFASEPAQILINRVVFDSHVDYVEFVVLSDGNIEGFEVYEGASVLLYTFPTHVVEQGDRFFLKFKSSQELVSDLTGLVYETENTGLAKTDGIIHVRNSQSEILDSVVWDDQLNRFSSSKSLVNTLIEQGEWIKPETGYGVHSILGVDEIGITREVDSFGIPLDTNTADDFVTTRLHEEVDANTVIDNQGVQVVQDVLGEEVLEKVIEVAFPKKIELGTDFRIDGLLAGFEPNTEFYLKCEGSFDGDTWYDALTVTSGGDILKWNSSWIRYPTVRTNKEGAASFDILGQIESEYDAGDYLIRLKVKSVESNESRTSQEYTVLATAVEPSPGEEVKDVVVEVEQAAEEQNVFEERLISELSDESVGVSVSIEGVVTASPEVLGVRVMYVEDESGGIKILLNKKNREDIERLDRVIIKGVVDSSFGELNIRVMDDEDITITGKVDGYEGQQVNTGDVGEENEGKLVHIAGEVTSTKGDTFYLDDGSGEAKVYIKESTRIEKPPMARGDYSSVVGISSQYKETYRVMPRSIEDVAIYGEAPGDMSVLGLADHGERILPRTGASYSSLGFLFLWVGFLMKKYLR